MGQLAEKADPDFRLIDSRLQCVSIRTVRRGGYEQKNKALGVKWYDALQTVPTEVFGANPIAVVDGMTQAMVEQLEESGLSFSVDPEWTIVALDDRSVTIRTRALLHES